MTAPQIDASTLSLALSLALSLTGRGNQAPSPLQGEGAWFPPGCGMGVVHVNQLLNSQ